MTFLAPRVVITPVGRTAAEIDPFFLGLTLTDEVGHESDRLSLDLVGGSGGAALPRSGDALDVSIGYGEALERFGRFTIDEVASRGGTGGATISVRAKAADMLAGLKAKRTTQHTQSTLGALVTDIANRHQLEPRCSDALAETEIWHPPMAGLAQTDESDLHFLTRLAARYDAVCKPVAGRLIFLPASESETAAGEKVPTIALSEGEVGTWSARAPERPKFESASASFIDRDTGERVLEMAGSGEPVLRLAPIEPDREAAKAAATAALSKHRRRGGELSISLPGKPALKAERRLQFTTSDPLASGLWRIIRATHSISRGGGYVTRIEAERPE